MRKWKDALDYKLAPREIDLFVQSCKLRYQVVDNALASFQDQDEYSITVKDVFHYRQLHKLGANHTDIEELARNRALQRHEEFLLIDSERYRHFAYTGPRSVRSSRPIPADGVDEEADRASGNHYLPWAAARMPGGN